MTRIADRQLKVLAECDAAKAKLNNYLPTFAEIAELRLSECEPRDKIITIKVTRATAQMMIAAEEKRLRALKTIVNSEELNTGSFVCDFESLQSVARFALQ